MGPIMSEVGKNRIFVYFSILERSPVRDVSGTCVGALCNQVVVDHSKNGRKSMKNRIFLFFRA